MVKLDYLEQLVTECLEYSQQARDDNFILIADVIKRLQPDTRDYSFQMTMRNHEMLNIPSFETITRVRRKILEKRPDLKPSAYIEKIMQEREEAFKEYSRT